MYVIVVLPAEPEGPAVTTPVDMLMFATDVLLLTHVPPVAALNNIVVCPSHTFREPVIADGNWLTVTLVAVLQPVGNV